MKRNLISLVSLLSLSLLLTMGCVKDNGNYDYKELPKMEIADYTIEADGENVDLLNNNTIIIAKNKHVVITPKYDFEASVKPKYKWSLIFAVQPAYPNPPIPEEIIGEEASLNYTFAQAPGKYYVVLEITNGDQTADFKKIVTFNLTIESVNGIGIVYQNGTNGDLMVFKTYEVDPAIPASDVFKRDNVFSLANAGSLLPGPMFIDFDYNNVIKYNIGTSNGLSQCDADMLVTSTDNTALFDARNIPTIPYAPQFMASNLEYTFTFLIIDGKLYARTGPKLMMCTNKFFKFNDNDYFPYVLMNDNNAGHIVFNRTAKAFEWLRQGAGMTGATGGWDYNPQVPLSILGGGSVDVGNTEMEVIAYGRSVENMVAIMKDDVSAELFSVVFKYPSSDNPEKVLKAECVSKISVTALPDMKESAVWEFGSRGNYAFYGSGNELHVLNTIAATSFNANVNIPADETISKISLLKYNKGDYSKTSGGVTTITDKHRDAMNGTVIFVATTKGNEGKVYQFTINPKNGRPDVTTKKVVEVDGVIKDIKLIRQL